MGSMSTALNQAVQMAGGPPSYNNKAFSSTQAQAILQAGGDINSIMAGWVDRGAWLYYDRIYQSTTSTYGGSAGVLAQTYSPFKVGLNSPDQITPGYSKTKLFTNLPNGGQFNPPRCMVIRRLGFYFEPTMLLADIETFMQNGYLEFRIDDKIFFEGLTEFWPGGMGLAGTTTQTAQAVYTNGIPTPHAMRDYGQFAKYIAPLQNFSLSIVFPSVSPFTGAAPSLVAAGSGGTGLNLVCIMDGLTDRSVA